MTLHNFSWVIEGKLAGHGAPSSEQDLEWLKKQGVLSLVRLLEETEADVSSHQIKQLGFMDCHVPVPDYGAPSLTQISVIIQFIEKSLSEGRPVGISCLAGLGRTGTILACYLVFLGYQAYTAIDIIRSLRPGSIENIIQQYTVKEYADQSV